MWMYVQKYIWASGQKFTTIQSTHLESLALSKLFFYSFFDYNRKLHFFSVSLLGDQFIWCTMSIVLRATHALVFSFFLFPSHSSLHIVQLRIQLATTWIWTEAIVWLEQHVQHLLCQFHNLLQYSTSPPVILSPAQFQWFNWISHILGP